MYEDIFESIRKAAEKRNLRERTIKLYCSNIRYFLRCTNKPVTDLTLEDADAFLTIMLIYGKEASNKKQEIDRQHHTIPNQRS